MEELYKQIPNFDGYEVSNMGNVKSYRVGKKGKVLKTIVGSRGYPLINLMKDSKMYQFTVHRLVAESFVDNPKNLPFVNHIDLDKENNRADNLEWVSGRENVTHYYNSVDTTCKYTGVYKQNGRFVVQIHINKERLSLGSYGDEEEARDVYIKGLEIFNKYGVDGILAYKNEVENKFSSQFKGVSFDKSRNKWTGSILFNGKKLLGKRFDSEVLAVEAVIKVYIDNNIPLHYSHKKYLEKL
jgi:hypothetical protein